MGPWKIFADLDCIESKDLRLHMRGIWLRIHILSARKEHQKTVLNKTTYILGRRYIIMSPRGRKMRHAK